MSFRESIWIFAHEPTAEEDRPIGFGRAGRARAQSRAITDLMHQLRAAGFPDAILEFDPALVVFQPLSDAARAEIARRALGELARRLQQIDGKTLEYDDALLEWLLSPLEGEPPSPEDIQHRVQVELATLLRRTAREQPEAGAAARAVRLRLQSETPDPAPPQPRVLVVDDMPDFYEALKATFPDWEWRWADSEDRADALLSEFNPHLTLIDTRLSEHDPNDTRGVGLLQRLKTRFPQQTFVIVSAQGENFDTTRDAFRAGAYDYMLKGEHSLLQELVNSRVQLEYEKLKAAQRQRAPAEVVVEKI